ncbi:MAG: Ig-like domain-containing protein [Longimicrobiales bacterium]
MIRTRPTLLALAALLGTALAPLPRNAAAQDVARIQAEPARVTLAAGASASFTVRAYDASGRVVDAPLRMAGPRQGLRLSDGTVTGLEAGEYEIFVSSVAGPEGEPVVLRIPVTVTWPAVAEVSVSPGPRGLITGARLRHRAEARHADGSERPNPEAAWTSSDPAVATVDAFGNVRGVAPGSVTITASVDGVRGSVTHRVAESPVVAVRLDGGRQEVRTGDVQSFTATPVDAAGRPVPDAPVSWSYVYQPDDSIVAPAGPAQILDGRMVADVPGVYTAVAATGGASAEFSFRVVPRDAVRSVEVVGQGREARVFSTDFWIWEGVDGRDYAMTGSKYGDGITMVWDVTDPANIVKTDSILVDARTTNDVKVSPDGRYGAISREGASNRRNGVVILDLADPAHPRIASTFEGNGVTGGVHNMFATDDYLFVLAGGDKYVILDVRDLENPRYVSEYNHPDSRVHDVWVHDGLAYSAEWGTGVVVVDVGNGRWGGSIENPVFVTSFPLTTGSTHAVFPYFQESTGRMLLIVGDERVQRQGLAWEGSGPDHRIQYDPVTGKGGYPRATSGYIQIVDFSDPMEPVQLARYEVSEYGTHNMWVEDDVLYQAYYEGGVRMVDISGDLMGNLYTQGREMAVFKAHDPVGYIPNSPGAWSVMPYKGNIFFSDINSGMWAVRMAPTERPIS